MHGSYTATTAGNSCPDGEPRGLSSASTAPERLLPTVLAPESGPEGFRPAASGPRSRPHRSPGTRAFARPPPGSMIPSCTPSAATAAYVEFHIMPHDGNFLVMLSTGRCALHSNDLSAFNYTYSFALRLQILVVAERDGSVQEGNCRARFASASVLGVFVAIAVEHGEQFVRRPESTRLEAWHSSAIEHFELFGGRRQRSRQAGERPRDRDRRRRGSTRYNGRRHRQS